MFSWASCCIQGVRIGTIGDAPNAEHVGDNCRCRKAL